MATEILTLPTAAARLGVHRVTLRRWIAAGYVEGAVQTPNGQIRVPAAALGALLQPIGGHRAVGAGA